MLVQCPGCNGCRSVRESDWARRKTDYCAKCGIRVRAGLDPSAEPGQKGIRLHNIWRGMRQRCGHVGGGHAHDLEHYQDRGIEVCPEWRGNFANFHRWALDSGYADNLVIDRRDNDLGYSPSNCRWVTLLVSNRNKRSVVQSNDRQAIRDAIGAGVTQMRLAERYGVTPGTITHIKQEAGQ